MSGMHLEMANFSSESVDSDSRPDFEFSGRATRKALLPFFLLPHEAIVAAVRAGSGTLGTCLSQNTKG